MLWEGLQQDAAQPDCASTQPPSAPRSSLARASSQGTLQLPSPRKSREGSATSSSPTLTRLRCPPLQERQSRQGKAAICEAWEGQGCIAST